MPLMSPSSDELKRLAAQWILTQDPCIVAAPEVSVFHLGKEFRFDVLALRTAPTYRLFGFEIKCTRQDFLQDKKWPFYQQFVNNFYFVCPNETIVSSQDVPRQVGLLYLKTNGAMTLRAKRKATSRELDNPGQILSNISMMLLKNKIHEMDMYNQLRPSFYLSEQS